MLRSANTTTMIFDSKSEKFELFEILFNTTVKMQPELKETMKTNRFHSLLQKNALQSFRNFNTNKKKQTLEDLLVVFKRKYHKRLPNTNGIN